MKYVNLGGTGLRVSRVCLGMMSFGTSTERPWAVAEDDAEPIVRAAVEGGVTFFDTADAYNGGASEVITGRLLGKLFRRDEVVVATKVFMPTGPGKNDRGLSRKHVLAAIDASLGRLGMDFVDLYQIHRWDYRTPIEETMAALHDVVRAGKARYIGASSMFAWQFAKAQYTADRHGWTRFVSMQDHYNLIYREEEREMIPQCIDQGVAVLPWSPLARGLLAGSRTRAGERRTSRSGTDAFLDSFYGHPADFDVIERAAEVAAARERPARAGRAGLAAAQAGGDRADRGRHPARARRGRAGRRTAGTHRPGDPPPGGALRHAPRVRPPVTVVAVSWLDQFTGRAAGGGVSGMGDAQLQQHLRGPWQREAIADERADGGGLERLGVQAREHPPARGVQQQPVQRLAGAQPVGAAIIRGEEHGGDGRARAGGGQQPQATAEVEVTLA